MLDFDWIASPIGVLMHRDRASKERLDNLLDILRSVAASARRAAGPRRAGPVL